MAQTLEQNPEKASWEPFLNDEAMQKALDQAEEEVKQSMRRQIEEKHKLEQTETKSIQRVRNDDSRWIVDV